MHYDVLYPNAVPGDEVEVDIIKSERLGICHFCGQKTQWMDKKSGEYCCSHKAKEHLKDD